MAEIIDLLKVIAQDLVYIKSQLNQIKQPRGDLEAWLDAQDVMQQLHISKRTLQNLRAKGQIPFSRINGKIYYKSADIQKLLKSNYQSFNTSKS